jgi:hypothetical protein
MNPMKAAARRLLFVTLASLGACTSADPPAPGPGLAPAPPPEAVPVATASCASRIAAVRARPSLPGAPAFDAVRVETLGRARGEPMVFVREPGGDAPATPTLRRSLARFRRDPAALRALALRDGYLYARAPDDALALATELHLVDLFDAPVITLQRGAETHRLVAVKGRERSYRHEGGSRDGHVAELVFGDRVTDDPAGLGPPLHRDLRALAEQNGLDRAVPVHLASDAMVLQVRTFGESATALVTADGAALELACLDAPEDVLARIAVARGATARRRDGMVRVSDAITAAVDETLRFDRPEGEKTAERDGHLRPFWLGAYLHGQQAFEHDGTTYAVYDPKGRPYPPEVCVDLVLDSFERAAGTWYRGRGEPPARVVGSLDFDSFGIKNRRGVLGFEQFAQSRPDLFESMRLPDPERVQFGERSRFFAYLVSHADDYRPGDVVAIQGRKRDGLIHQHAILIERTDPVTGFPYGLADQMKRPRRRTWEGIMAEAPLRSLLYRVRPTDKILAP